MEITVLAPINNENALEVFTSDKLDDYLKAIEEDALNFVGDTETAKGREQIASKAHGIAKEKVRIDNIGKVLVADWKQKSYLVDQSRKKARDFLDEVKVKVRQPLNDYEAQKKAEEDAKRAAVEKEMDWEEAIKEDETFDHIKDIERREAELVEKEKERADREKAEREEQELKERELRVAQEAKEKAEREAQAKIDAVKKAAQDKIDEANRIQEAKEEEKREAQRLADRKAANLNHQRKINREALEGFINNKVDGELGKKMITLIAKGEIKHIFIKY